MSILLLESLHPDAERLLASYTETHMVGEQASAAFDPRRVEAILTRGRGRITAELIASCPQLRTVARCGVGLDNIDLAAAQAHGITVVYAPGTTTTAVAEHTLMLILALARQLRPLAQAVHQGAWEVRNGYVGMELAGKTLGIVGFGQIGQRVAGLASAFGMQVVTWSPHQRGAYPALTLEQLLGSADLVSIHVALSDATRALIGARELALMKPGALLINTARGAIIDQVALRGALAAGRLGGFAADVLDQEPPATGEPLLAMPNVLITPHVAALTETTYRAICVETATNVLAILRGETPNPGSVYRS
jgi:D-3-phosphoglycerate dehydrogenase / 2-oxoglutarate reductase